MADGRYDPGVTEPGWPALRLDGLDAVVFDTDGVLTDTARVRAGAWAWLGVPGQPGHRPALGRPGRPAGPGDGLWARQRQGPLVRRPPPPPRRPGLPFPGRPGGPAARAAVVEDALADLGATLVVANLGELAVHGGRVRWGDR